MNEKSIKVSDEMLRQLSERAARDKEFRALCKQDILAAIKQETGKDVPESIRIQVVDSSGYDLTIILPEKREHTESLNDHELDQVAGGYSSNQYRSIWE